MKIIVTLLNDGDGSEGASREEWGGRSFMWGLFSLPRARLCFEILVLALKLTVKILIRKFTEMALSWAKWDFPIWNCPIE